MCCANQQPRAALYKFVPTACTSVTDCRRLTRCGKCRVANGRNKGRASSTVQAFVHSPNATRLTRTSTNRHANSNASLQSRSSDTTRIDKNHQRNLVGSRVGCKHCTHKLPPRGSWRMPAHWRRRFMTHWRPRMTACSLIGMRRVRAKVWIHERSCDGVLPVLIVSVHRWLCRQGSGSANPQAGTVATERWPEWPPCAGLCVRDRHAINWSCAARLPSHCH